MGRQKKKPPNGRLRVETQKERRGFGVVINVEEEKRQDEKRQAYHYTA